MRIATWNVNSLKARLEKVGWWLERARPDVLLLQETKLSDGDVPREQLEQWGYAIAHHGEGRWNGVAIASRVGIADVVTNFGDPLRPAATPDVGDDEPLAEARMIAATCGGVRVLSIYAPNGRTVGSPFFVAKLAWYARLAEWLARAQRPSEPLLVGGDFNVAPSDADVWDATACHGGTHVSPEERAAFTRLCDWGLVDGYRLVRSEPERYSWWDYRAGMFHKNYGSVVAAGDARGVGRDRPRGAQGQADPVGPRAGGARSRRAGARLRRRLGGGDGPRRRAPRRQVAAAGTAPGATRSRQRGRFRPGQWPRAAARAPARASRARAPAGRRRRG
jgi:exodeoxyribonuclease-3